MDCGTAGTFDEVIDCADQDDAWSVFANGDIDVIGSSYELGCGQVGNDSHEAVLGVVVIQAFANLVCGDTWGRVDVDCREYSAFHWGKVGGEDDFRFNAAEAMNDIDDFWLVPMVTDGVSGDRLVGFAVEV